MRGVKESEFVVAVEIVSGENVHLAEQKVYLIMIITNVSTASAVGLQGLRVGRPKECHKINLNCEVLKYLVIAISNYKYKSACLKVMFVSTFDERL